jgi:hypothetical protein
MNKNLNIIIFSLLILSFWLILSIGIGLIPIFNLSIFSTETSIKINTCLLNIAYSYLAGFIMYIFTVTIPYNIRKKTNLIVINHYIHNYCYSSSTDFITSCLKMKSIKYNELDLEKIQKLKDQFLKNENGEYSWNLVFVNDKMELKDRLIKMSNETKDFINNIIPYSDFLSNEQLPIFNRLRTDGSIISIDCFLNFIYSDKLLYHYLSKHDELVGKLNLTIGDYNKIKPIKKSILNRFKTLLNISSNYIDIEN